MGKSNFFWSAALSGLFEPIVYFDPGYFIKWVVKENIHGPLIMNLSMIKVFFSL